MKAHVRFARTAGMIGVTCACIITAGWCGGLRCNVTPSWPLGIWRLSSGPWGKGDIVLVDVPSSRPIFRTARARGYLRAGLFNAGCLPLLKRVVAVAGDHVQVGDAVSVDGQLLPNSALLRTDSSGRALPREGISGVVPAGCVWVMSEHSPSSFDSRYFGAVPVSLIRGRAQPLWTW